MAQSRVRTFARLAVAAAFAAVALTGCVRLTADTTVSDADTFSQTIIVATTPAARSQLGDAAEVDLDLANLKTLITSSEAYTELLNTYPDQVAVEDFEDGDLTGVKVVTTDLPLAEFERSLAQLSASAPLTGAASLVRTGDTYVVTVPAGGAAESLEEAGVTAGQLALLSGQVDIGFTFTFPGLVTSATAGEVEGHTVTLGLPDLASGEDITIVAGAGNETDWKPWLMWGGIGLATLVIVGGAIALIVQDVRRHRANALPPPDAEAGENAEGPGILATGGEAEPEATDPDESP